MQPQEIEKLKDLVETSPLLSMQERQEWLMLLDLMNDKQMWELKKILESTSNESRVISKEPAAGQASVKSQESRVKKQEPEMEIPPLTHIMNLPKAQAVFPHGDGSKIITPPTPSYGFDKLTTGLKRGEDNKTRFWQKIKDVLKEKELPPGHPEPTEELELPAPPRPVASASGGLLPGYRSRATGSGPASKSAISNPAFAKASADRQQSAISTPKPPVVPPPLPAKPKAEEPLPAAPVNPEVQELVQSVIKKREIRLKEGAGDKAGDKFFMPGLKDTKVLMDAKLAEPLTKPLFDRAVPPRPSPLREGKGMPQALRAEKAKISADVNNLEQVSRLSTRELQTDLAPSLKRLSQTYGYHKLVLALEKSPAYLSYLNTGMASLTGKYDLDTGEYKVKTLERFLTKEEFERFVDVLRAIKT